VNPHGTSNVHPTAIRVRTLNAILQHAVPALEEKVGSLGLVRRGDIGWRDQLLVRTKNSDYSIHRAGRDTWYVWGGWFAHHGEFPARVRINGCTWGGSVIYPDLLAAPGLFLEFANGVTTTRIRSVSILSDSRPEL